MGIGKTVIKSNQSQNPPVIESDFAFSRQGELPNSMQQNIGIEGDGSPCTCGIHTSKDLSVANSFAMAHNLTACESSASRAAAAFRTIALEATNVVAI